VKRNEAILDYTIIAEIATLRSQ